MNQSDEKAVMTSGKDDKRLSYSLDSADVSKFLCFRKVETKKDPNSTIMEQEEDKFLSEESLDEQIKNFLLQEEQSNQQS